MTARLAAGGATAAAGTRRPVGVRRTRVRPRTPRDGRTRPAQTYLPTYLPTYLALIREISKYFTNSILELLGGARRAGRALAVYLLTPSSR